MTDRDRGLIETFINGNLKDAQRLAKSRTHKKLREDYQECTGCIYAVAVAAADYLKGSITFGQFCEVERKATNANTGR